MLSTPATAQKAKPAHTIEPTEAAQQGVALAQKGQCAQALPLLKKGAHVEDKDLKRRVGLGTVRCAMMMDQPETAVDAVLMLNREFPHDPEVLYVTTHAYSDLSTRASLELAQMAPSSYQAHELNAEALEQQGKWDQAEKEYETILEKNPNLPGIHFRLARVILSMPASPTTAEDARKELEAELKIDPDNADAEYVLGELAREQQQFDVAIVHFDRATKLDPGFPDALRGLGMSLNAAGKFAEAVSPLERYVKLRPGDPAGHYQLAIACARSGRREEAEQQMKLQQEADEAVRRAQGQAGTPGQPATSQP
ncbi:MAG TPA: tetratricopeptide repeat protein [Verrucomicrobiae bacterium]|nr:tetratricopeptide repeat protein [Verrucomicrobiae bacterium]